MDPRRLRDKRFSEWIPEKDQRQEILGSFVCLVAEEMEGAINSPLSGTEAKLQTGREA